MLTVLIILLIIGVETFLFLNTKGLENILPEKAWKE